MLATFYNRKIEKLLPTSKSSISFSNIDEFLTNYENNIQACLEIFKIVNETEEKEREIDP